MCEEERKGRAEGRVEFNSITFSFIHETCIHFVERKIIKVIIMLKSTREGRKEKNERKKREAENWCTIHRRIILIS